MNSQKIKTVCQSTLLMKQQQNYLIEYAHIFNNHIFIYDTHINFNGDNIINDRNSKTQFTVFTNDGAYLFIAMAQPNAISILNTRTGHMLVARGLEQICNQKILAFSMQPDEHIASQRKTKRLYFLYEVRGSLMLKLIQIENQIDDNPKTRTKLIEQNIFQGSTTLRFQPIFCNLSWSTFIIFKKEFRVFMIKKEGQQLVMNFSAQSFQPNIFRLTSNFNVLGFAQNTQTWAIICGNPVNSRNQTQISLNIFWQHKEKNQLCRNLYFRDDSFIKSISLPINQGEYAKIWQINGYYLIQSINKRNGVHKCCIVHQDQSSGSIITIDLLQGSQLCERTLEITPQHIGICQIKSKVQLYQTKVFGKKQGTQENIGSNYPNTNSTRGSTQMNSSDIQRNKNKQSVQTVRTEQNIKKFTPTNQTHVSTQSIGQGAELNQTKVLREQISKKEITIPTITTFVNQKIVQHLKKNQIRGNSQQSELQAPNSIQRLVSFGTNNLTQPKPPSNHNISFGTGNESFKQNAVISFAAQKQTPDASNAQNNSTEQNALLKPKIPTIQSADEINEKIKVHKEKYLHVKGEIQKMQEALCKQLENKRISLKENYFAISQELKMSLETVFTATEQQNIKRQLSCLEQYSPFIRKLIKKNQILEIQIKNAHLFIQQCKQLLNKFGISPKQQTQQIQLQSFRKFIKSTKKEVSLQSKTISHLQKIKVSYFKLEKDVNLAYNILKQKEKSISVVKKQNKNKNDQNLSMKQMFKIMHGKKIKTNENEKCMKRPISKVQWVQKKQPEIILSPLQ